MATVEGDETAITSSNQTEPTQNIICLLKAVGGAPILNQQRWTIPRTRTLASIASFLRKHMQLPDDTSLFLYVNQAFAPALDTTIGAINDCFHSNGRLVLNYAVTPAWG